MREVFTVVCGSAPHRFLTRMKRLKSGAVVRLMLAVLLFPTILPRTAPAQTAGSYLVTNIMSDGFVPALVTDPGFIDPWGVSIGGRFWINTTVTGLDYVASTAGAVAFKVTVPAPGGTGIGQPTGSLQNPTAGFVLSNGAKASFLFATLDGTVTGWNSALMPGNHSLVAIDNSLKHALYTDLALVTNTTGSYLLLANFGQGAAVEVYDNTFKATALAGSFTDPNLPTGYAPYSVHAIGSQVFVTYTLRSTPNYGGTAAGSYQEILGTNTGFVSVFDVNGNFIQRAITGGNLNAPWGVAMAPATFGIYGGDLLVGNFGDGIITVYDPNTFAYLGELSDGSGKAIAYPGLWALVFGKASYGDPNAMYFSAGLAHETHGLFGVVNNVTNSSALPTFGMSASTQVATVSSGGTVALTVAVAPVNSFAGSVALSCSGLPAGTTCSFAPAALSVLPNAPATSIVTIKTSTSARSMYAASPGRKSFSALAIAMVLPLGSLTLLFNRQDRSIASWIRSAILLLLLSSMSLVTGCSSSTPQTAATPIGTSNITIQGASGGVTQTSMVALTVQ